MDLQNEFENFVMFTLQSCENFVNKQCNLNSYIFLCWNNNFLAVKICVNLHGNKSG